MTAPTRPIRQAVSQVITVAVEDDRDRWVRRVRRAGRLVFGDRPGLTLWLGIVVALGLTWRVGFFITDTYAVANAFASVADGSLAIRENRYSLTLSSQPGLYETGGRLYGRNYGQVVIALPVLWALRAATAVSPLHLVLAGGWSLAVLAFANRLAVVTGRDAVRGGGIAVAFGVFLVNVLAGSPIDPTFRALVALQLSTLLAAAFAGVFLYRLVGTFHDRSVAVAAGAAVVLAFPIGFWSTIPKRHVLVATLLLASTFCFARSRHASGRRAYAALAGAYLFASLVAWVHAYEGFFALACLGVVDLLTAGVRDRKRLGVIVLAVAAGLAPMFLTNALISGDPFAPPRLLPNQGAGGVELAPSGEVTSADGGGGNGASIGGDGGWTASGSGGTDGAGTGPSGGGVSVPGFVAPVVGPLVAVLGEVGFVLGFAASAVGDGVAVLSDAERLWHIFGRRGYVEEFRYGVNDNEVIDLTVLESAPLLGALLALPVVAVGSLRSAPGSGRPSLAPWRLSPVRQTDLLVAAFGTVLAVVYLSRLPLYSQITVRYVVYAMPFWLYGAIRLAPVRTAVVSRPKLLGRVYAASAVGGILLLGVTLAVLDVAVGEAMQFHALVHLGAAAVLALLVAGRALAPERVPGRALTIWLAVTAGLTTAFLALAGLEYFQYGPFVLGVSRRLSVLIPVV